MIARVRATLRLADRAAGTPTRRLHFGSLLIDVEGRAVSVDGAQVNLTPKEFDLLSLNAGRVYGRDTLLEKVWGYDYAGESRTVDVHIQRLRQKIESDPHNLQFLVTVRNIGYKSES